MRRFDLETALVEDKVLTSEAVQEAQEKSSEAEITFEQALIDLGHLTDRKIAEIKGRLLEVRVVDLSKFPISPEAATSIPESLARRHCLIPILMVKDVLNVAMADPLDVDALDDVAKHSGCRVEVVLSTAKEINNAIERFYGVFGVIEDLIKKVGSESVDMEGVPSKEIRSRYVVQSEGPVSQIIHAIIKQAVNVASSDIHFEPQEERIRVRFRIDGILQEFFVFEKKYQAAITSSTKIMAAMDIAEKRSPQDGRFRVNSGGRHIDIRASSYPTIHGEKIVLRLLHNESSKLSLDELGMQESDHDTLQSIIHKPHGIFLVTGPTGSGKTTTLYGVLNMITNVNVNVITLEDPIEYDLPAVNQGQVNPKAGLTFASGLRSILRQDPDIIMVGEIRDGETAEIATQAALTGHLVLSTLHTNDAAGAVTRMVEMGVEPFLVASALEGVMAQRLVRRLCTKCRKAYQPSKEVMERLGITEFAGCVFYQPQGCRECARTGYKGRVGIFELMPLSEEVRSLIVAKKSTSEIRNLVLEQGMQPMRWDGIQKAIAGITSLEEVTRIVGGD